MDKEELRKEFEAIRQDRQQYDRDRILDSWEAMILFRNRELENRVSQLERKLFFQSASNYAFVICIGILVGILLSHILL